MLKHSFMLIVALLTISGCGVTKDESADEAESSKAEEMFAPGYHGKKTTDVDIGDVEAMVHFNAMLAPESQSDTIRVTELSDQVERVKLVTLDVAPPYPEHLWLQVSFHARRAFDLTPVVLRTKVYADEREIGSFMLVAGAQAEAMEHQEKFDVLQGLESKPDTMLVRVKTEGLLMPPGTDEATLDPKTATTTPDRVTRAIPGTLVRINFKPASSPP